jgi:hypothetical protein
MQEKQYEVVQVSLTTELLNSASYKPLIFRSLHHQHDLVLDSNFHHELPFFAY